VSQKTAPGTRSLTLGSSIREGLDAGKPTEYRAAALPKLLKTLSNNTVAEHAFEDPRPTDVLLKDAAAGDRAAEAPLYVRLASELDRMAAIAVGSSAFEREDLHQEGALRLIEDARSGKILADFRGKLGPYLGKAILGHLRNVASTQSPGKPTDPGRLTQKLREALRSTADEHGEYDFVGAATYARKNFSWGLSTFWDVHRMMFSAADDLHKEPAAGYSLTETIGDPTAEDALARVEDTETARALRASAHLSPRDREVVDLMFGFDGPALSESEAGKVLGISQQAVSKAKARALDVLRAVAEASN
jgi:RNA polymerase sigma factor (sigma-70 family)